MELLSKINSYIDLAVANIDYVILAILLFIFLILLLKKLVWLAINHKYQNIDKLIREFSPNPLEFEAFVAKLFEMKGYKTELTGGSGDGGKDIIMYKGRHKYAVEVKLYKRSHRVDREKIQKLHSAMIDCGADRGFFVTTSDFSDPAIEYAEKYDITPIDGEELHRMIKSCGLRF